MGIQSIRNFKIALPPLKTQNKIADILEKKFKNFNNLLKKIEEKLNLIREYRQSLISSVVTGKIRITEDML